MSDKNILYGVDLNKSVTPIMSRDALVLCFVDAHCIDTGLGDANSEIVKKYVKDIVAKAFKDSGNDFEKPTKQSIIAAMDNLKIFAASFCNQSIIQKHYSEMMKIVDKMSE